MSDDDVHCSRPQRDYIEEEKRTDIVSVSFTYLDDRKEKKHIGN